MGSAAGWLEKKRFCARKREKETEEEDSTDGLFTFSKPSDWGPRGEPLYLSIFQIWTVRNLTAFSSIHMHQAVFEVWEDRKDEGWAGSRDGQITINQ